MKKRPFSANNAIAFVLITGLVTTLTLLGLQPGETKEKKKEVNVVVMPVEEFARLMSTLAVHHEALKIQAEEIRTLNKEIDQLRAERKRDSI